MSYEFNFGSIASAGATPAAPKAFRIALLGDFSARANRGEQESGADLAGRKPHKVDIDNIDDVLARMDISLTIPVGGADAQVEVEVGSMDDFHPDELFDNVEVFEELASLRRKLNSAKWEAAAKDLEGWAKDAGKYQKKKKTKARGSAIPNARLSGFGELMSRPTGADRGASTVDALVRSVVGPHAVASRDAAQDDLIRVADEALSGLMRDILHHPDFQTVESVWRSVDFLTRRLETGRDLQIVLYDVTAEELAADLAAAEDLGETGLYSMLVEKPAQDAQQGPLSLVVGLYDFEQTPPHAELLGRMAKVAAAANAPFISGMSNDVIRKPYPEDTHPLVLESWEALRGVPEAGYVGLACPRFMLRNPYGQKTDPIDPFKFEEFTMKGGVSGMLWGNGAVLTTLMIAESFKKAGKLAGLRLGSVSAVGDMPYHYYTDEHGDQVALPCTNRLLSEKSMGWVTTQGFIPVLSVRGAPEARIGGFIGLTGKALAGPWSDPASLPKPEAEASGKAAVESPEDEEDTGTDDADDSSDDGDDDLDALLASLEDDDDDSGSDDSTDDDDEEMDPELAALLAELD